MPQQINDFWFVNGAWLCRSRKVRSTALQKSEESLPSEESHYPIRPNSLGILMSRKCSNPLRRNRAD